MTRDNALRKARALFNTAAEGSGATDAESATARVLALQLLAAHGMTEADAREVAAKNIPAPAVVVFGGIYGFKFHFDNSATGSTASVTITP